MSQLDISLKSKIPAVGDVVVCINYAYPAECKHVTVGEKYVVTAIDRPRRNIYTIDDNGEEWYLDPSQYKVLE